MASHTAIVQLDHFLNDSADEQPRRPKVVESARWFNRMKQHGAPLPERIALDVASRMFFCCQDV